MNVINFGGRPLPTNFYMNQNCTNPEFTQFYGETAIYCVTFVSEEVAKLAAEQSKVNLVSVYTLD